jgi:mRNA interferase HigB
MIVVGQGIIHKFLKSHADCSADVAELVRDLESATLRSPDDVRLRYPSAKVLNGRLVVFKVRGNHYRLSMQIAYKTGIASVIALETHADYDRRNLR